MLRVVTDEPSESLAVVVGRNCKRIRSAIGVTQDELAQRARLVGLRWTASAVGDFEAGRSAPSFATVLAVGMALQIALEDTAEQRKEVPKWGVTLADLLEGEGSVALTDRMSVPTRLLAAACRGRIFAHMDRESIGEWFERARKAEGLVFADVGKVIPLGGLTEHRLAKRLGISTFELASLSAELWQTTFSEERDRRAGPDANQQKRGRISRELRAELEKAFKKALADGND
jgi:transcriptional regulator with XRE-family HTH domain